MDLHTLVRSSWTHPYTVAHSATHSKCPLRSIVHCESTLWRPLSTEFAQWPKKPVPPPTPLSIVPYPSLPTIPLPAILFDFPLNFHPALNTDVIRIIPTTDARDTCCQPHSPRDLVLNSVPFNFFPHPFILALVNHPVVMSTSTTTTQILFNSPALHSLKRDQLLKLCKIHNIKAAGKNVDLIERLKQHATTLPPDAPLNVAVRSEDDSDSMSFDDSPPRTSQHYPAMSRPSEAWEVVMDDIQELPETSSSQNTLNSLRTVNNNAGEFGTANSKCKPVASIA